jgi:hypothetical protein
LWSVVFACWLFYVFERREAVVWFSAHGAIFVIINVAVHELLKAFETEHVIATGHDAIFEFVFF